MIDVEQTLEKLGVEGRPSGGEFVGHCPMHLQRTGREDANPSWSINLTTGLFICFSCGYKGSILTLISDLTGVSIDEAKTTVVRPPLQDSVARIPKSYIKVEKDPVLKDSLLAQFRQPPLWARNRRKVTRDACQQYGVRWDTTKDMWILPIRLFTGDLIGWQEKSEMSRSFRNYPLGVPKSKCLFGFDSFVGGRMVVVESPLDAVRLASNGVTGAVATYGAYVSKEQIRLMTSAEEVVFALDNPNIDTAGRKSMTSLLSETKGALASVRFFHYGMTDAKDPGEMTPEEIEQGIAFAKSRAYGERAIS